MGNRTFTFSYRDKKPLIAQYVKAVLAAIFAFIPNILIFTVAISMLPDTVIFSVIAFSLGTAVGIVFNYILSDKYVF